MTNRRVNKRRIPLCLECATERMEANAYNISAHRGPGYDRWVAGVTKFLANEATTRGVSTTRASAASPEV